LIPFMPFDFAQESVRQAHHERNQLFAVRPELVEGSLSKEACRRKLVEGLIQKSITLVFAFI
jgi:hypothetical protein